jgi:hypothetical protein
MFVSEDRPMGRTRAALLAGSSCLELGYGRFMQTDPIGYDDGLNWYNYVGDDPVNETDASGLGPEVVVIGKLIPIITPKVVVAVVGAVTGIVHLFSSIFGGHHAKPPKTNNNAKQDQPNKQASQQRPICPAVPSGGAGAGQISKNIAEALRQRAMNAGGNWSIFAVPALEGGTGIWFSSQVKTGGAWDYKNKGYSAGQNYGNFNYGATSASLGYDWPTTMGGAHAYSLIDNGTLESQSSVIRAGFDYARLGCHP